MISKKRERANYEKKIRTRQLAEPKEKYEEVKEKNFYAVVNLRSESGGRKETILTGEILKIYHCGDDSDEVPPVLIPNTEVKLISAENT